MKTSVPIVWLAACLAAVCFATLGCNRREQWPYRPVTLVCPWSAGGGTDRVSRQFAVQLESELGVPVNVVNATGGGGVTGHTRGATAPADGYTLTMATVELNMLHWRSLCPITPDSFEPLARINQDAAAVFVSTDSPWQSIEDLEGKLRESTDPLRASGTAAGGIWHLALLGWLDRSELPSDAVTWVSINGAAPSLQELMAGGVEVVCCSIPEARALVDAGKIRCLGVMSNQRSPAAPDVATFAEQGVDWSIGAWRGLLYPKGVPAERVTGMRQAVLRVAGSNEFRQFMQASGFQVAVADGEQFASFLAQSDADFGRILNQPQMTQSSASAIGPYFLPTILAALGLAIAVFGWGVSRRTQGSDVTAEPTGRVNWKSLLRSKGIESRRATVATFARRWFPNAFHALASVATLRLFGFAAVIVWFIVTCETLGYVISAGVMLIAMLLMLRVRLPIAVTATLVIVPSLYHGFAGMLGVPLPWGWLGW
ncbi:Tripartite tricarboxylate transporter family receptor [Stieleria maiorica]|uniref:Tripartite tricarboxylate transporter family receptor n=1 Tax=Stieleria maiorica TaxID=2795974 RepID=A0A5B9MKY5_9BACT|nr:tripartite tricarboxylate transporter substrate binding protein [Stieleria maiorica]QEG01929.1 Tripartite tricarboxylate transporter family receptor [Stieleria maiorica]